MKWNETKRKIEYWIYLKNGKMEKWRWRKRRRKSRNEGRMRTAHESPFILKWNIGRGRGQGGRSTEQYSGSELKWFITTGGFSSLGVGIGFEKHLFVLHKSSTETDGTTVISWGCACVRMFTNESVKYAHRILTANAFCLNDHTVCIDIVAYVIFVRRLFEMNA